MKFIVFYDTWSWHRHAYIFLCNKNSSCRATFLLKLLLYFMKRIIITPVVYFETSLSINYDIYISMFTYIRHKLSIRHERHAKPIRNLIQPCPSACFVLWRDHRYFCYIHYYVVSKEHYKNSYNWSLHHAMFLSLHFNYVSYKTTFK